MTNYLRKGEGVIRLTKSPAREIRALRSGPSAAPLPPPLVPSAKEAQTQQRTPCTPSLAQLHRAVSSGRSAARKQNVEGGSRRGLSWHLAIHDEILSCLKGPSGGEGAIGLHRKPEGKEGWGYAGLRLGRRGLQKLHNFTRWPLDGRRLEPEGLKPGRKPLRPCPYFASRAASLVVISHPVLFNCHTQFPPKLFFC